MIAEIAADAFGLDHRKAPPGRLARERSEHARALAEARTEQERATGELNAQHERALGQVRAELAATSEALAQERAGTVRRQTEWDGLLKGAFADLSQRALRQNNEQFLHLAAESLAKAREVAAGDLDQRRQAIAQMLAPFRDQLGKYEQGLRQLELDRQNAYSELKTQVQQLGESQDRLRSETRNLVTALRAPATRGQWGELHLRKVVEMAGLVEHVDFDVQVTTGDDDTRQRPDLVVHFPGGKQFVVDAKVPLQAFLDANDAADEVTRRAHLASHARQLRAHIDGLSKRSYWQQFDPAPEFVVAFVPGDPLLAAAYEHDAGLFEHAVAHQVLLATPTTLIALLRTVAFGWQQEALAENAREVQQAGRELYRRLATFGEHMAGAGRGLLRAVESYNRAVGSLERNVLPQARRFNDLGLVGSSESKLPELDAVDATPRVLAAPELAAGEDDQMLT
jgi:DNA recombination protein RmuC